MQNDVLETDTEDGRSFNTGSVRGSRIGKGRYDLASPIADEAKAAVNEFGAQKYAPRNWEKGQPEMVYVDSLRRHLNRWLMGEELDPESGLPHLAHVAWNSDALLHTDLAIKQGVLPESLDNRPRYYHLPSAVKPPALILTDAHDDGTWREPPHERCDAKNGYGWQCQMAADHLPNPHDFQGLAATRRKIQALR